MQKVSNFKTATAYAEAWFEASKDAKLEDTVFEEVKALKNGIGDIASLWATLSSPIELTDSKLKIIDALAKKTKISQISEKALKLMAENNRLNIFNLVADEFIRLYYQYKGIVEVFAESAIKLTDIQDKKLKQILEKKLNSPVVINYQVNPQVLGGLAVRFNSYLVDDTIKTKLEKIGQLLTKGN